MKVQETIIPGVIVIDLDIYDDERGSFCDAWQEEKVAALGLPPFVVRQWNVAESKKGVTRGIHVEPWDKYIHVTRGNVFAAIVDTREGDTYGFVATVELDHTKALFVPEGCGNSYQVLSDDAIYMYLVTGLWVSGVEYPAIALDDPTLAIPWPLSQDEWVVSEKDLRNPLFERKA